MRNIIFQEANQYTANVTAKFGICIIFSPGTVFYPANLQTYCKMMIGKDIGKDIQHTLTTTQEPNQKTPVNSTHHPTQQILTSNQQLHGELTQLKEENIRNSSKIPRMMSSFEPIFKASWSELKKIEDANENLLVEKEIENGKLRKQIEELKTEMEALKVSKQQLCCNDCGAVVEKVVYCTQVCHEAAIRKKILQNDLEN